MSNMCTNFKINTCDETNIFWLWVWTLFTWYTNDENDGYLDCIFVYTSVIMMKWLNSWWLWLSGLYTNDEAIRYLATNVISMMKWISEDYMDSLYVPMKTLISDISGYRLYIYQCWHEYLMTIATNFYIPMM